MKKDIDIFSKMVMNIYNNKGVFALLLGSGISLPAKIMSGWKVTEDLIKKLAVVQGEDIADDAFEWFKNKYGCEAGYSKLLEQLGHKPSEMESLLRPYFEPTEEDMEFGYKKPTNAHKAIAEMAQRGYFKVIITTNFDRLLESAMDELGVRYQVIYHESEIESRVPLYHHPLTLLKINGDYKDCRFRNTEKELSDYPQELVTYLDAIMKNFGIITCGWSATWDKALIKQIISNENHRYSYFYTYVGDKKNELDSLNNSSKGELLQIDNADTFFSEMSEKLKALELINGKNMEADVEVAVARVKMYIADLKKLIQYTDLYENVTDQLLRDVKDVVYGPQYPSASLFEQVIAENANALSTLLPMSIVAIRWAVNVHYQAIVDSLYAVANREIVRPNSSYEATVRLNHMLDTVYLYGLGVASVYYKRYGLLDMLFRVKFYEHDNYFSPYIIDQDNLWIADKQIWNSSTNYSRQYTPFSSHISEIIRPYFTMIHDDKEYYATVCIFEKLLAMYYYVLISKSMGIKGGWPPMGMFCWRPRCLERSRNYTYKDFFEKVNNEKNNSQVIKDGLFEGQYELYKEAYEFVTEIEKKAGANMY